MPALAGHAPVTNDDGADPAVQDRSRHLPAEGPPFLADAGCYVDSTSCARRVTWWTRSGPSGGSAGSNAWNEGSTVAAGCGVWPWVASAAGGVDGLVLSAPARACEAGGPGTAMVRRMPICR